MVVLFASPRWWGEEGKGGEGGGFEEQSIEFYLDITGTFVTPETSS